MSDLYLAMERYVLMRRGFGYRYKSQARYLELFVAFMDAQGASIITSKLAMAWVTRSLTQQKCWPNRLAAVRGFARHLSSSEPRTEVPPTGAFPSAKRPTPHIYTDAEIRQLLAALLSWGYEASINRWTYHYLFSLLVVTGMRLGEALLLKRTDVDLDAGILTLRDTKGGKNRLVPLQMTTAHALADYASRRDVSPARHASVYFFVLEHGNRVRPQYAQRIFSGVLRKIGLRDAALHTPGPRIHDLRHSFAVNTILRWYRAGEDVERMLPSLSTYLGHSQVRDTYWYLSACPELMTEAVRRLEAWWEAAT